MTSIDNQTQATTQPIFKSFSIDLKNVSIEQSKIIGLIIEKLHSIYSKRQPEAVSNNNTVENSIDLQQDVQLSLNRIYINNNALSDVLSHLNQII